MIFLAVLWQCFHVMAPVIDFNYTIDRQTYVEWGGSGKMLEDQLS